MEENFARKKKLMESTEDVVVTLMPQTLLQLEETTTVKIFYREIHTAFGEQL